MAVYTSNCSILLLVIVVNVLPCLIYKLDYKPVRIGKNIVLVLSPVSGMDWGPWKSAPLGKGA